jgi:hypothetical protein
MFFNVVCISLTVKVFDIIDAWCNHEEYLHVMHKIVYKWTITNADTVPNMEVNTDRIGY